MIEVERKSQALSPTSHLYWLHFRTLERFILQQLKYAEAPLLDLGCGARPYKPYCPPGESVGADVVPASNGAVDVLITPGEPLPFPDGRFATVLCTQVMEHVADPHWLIDESFRVLRPGGRLILTVPFVWELHERPHDYLRFTEYWLAENLKKAGFQIWEFDRQGGDVATIGQMICLLLAVRRIHLPRWVQRLYNKFFAFLDRKSHNKCMPLNYGMVCLKPAAEQKGAA